MRHFINFRDFTSEELISIAYRATEIKLGSEIKNLSGKIFGMLFFKPSLRTRVSFEAGLSRHGGSAITLTMGTDGWAIETKEGSVMDGSPAEHVKESAKVLSRYCDFLGVRSAPEMCSYEDEKADSLISSFGKYSTVPVINLESNFEHPCQAIADLQTLQEKNAHRKKFVFTWLPGKRVSPLATPHSIPMGPTMLGMDVTIVHPPGYDLDPRYIEQYKKYQQESNGSFQVISTSSVEQRDQILSSADFVYGKSWASPQMYGNTEAQSKDYALRADWKIGFQNISHNGKFMHCLPLRRNLKVMDNLLDSEKSIVIDQAENRMWAQLSVLEYLCKG